jgi:uncharacterized protein (DUF1499 family)
MRLLRWLILATTLACVVAAATLWPRVREAETGTAPGSGPLAPRIYSQSPAEVSRAVETALAALPGWSLRASGSGAAGHAIQAEHRLLRFAPFAEDVTVTIRPTERGSRISARSRSRVGPWDLGQNARNLRELLAELDRRLARPRGNMGESFS